MRRILLQSLTFLLLVSYVQVTHSLAQTPLPPQLSNLMITPQTAQKTADTAAVVPPRHDNQFWSENHLIKHLSKRTDLDIVGVIRTGRNFARPVDERIGAGIAFKINPHLTIMPTYLYVDYQPYEGRRISEHRLVMNITGKTAVGKWNLADRNLIERRVRHGSADFTVYRNRLQLDTPWRLTSLKLRPYVADEIWHSTQTIGGKDAGWFRNRISAGVSKQLTEHAYGEVFYLHQNDGKSRPGNLNTIGTLFRYTL